MEHKRPCKSTKTWDEVLMNDREKLGIDSADLQNFSDWRRHLWENLSGSKIMKY